MLYCKCLKNLVELGDFTSTFLQFRTSCSTNCCWEAINIWKEIYWTEYNTVIVNFMQSWKNNKDCWILQINGKYQTWIEGKDRKCQKIITEELLF